MPERKERWSTGAISKPRLRPAALQHVPGPPALLAFELVGLRWDMLDLAQGNLHVHRLKNGRPSVHTVRGSELRALR